MSVMELFLMIMHNFFYVKVTQSIPSTADSGNRGNAQKSYFWDTASLTEDVWTDLYYSIMYSDCSYKKHLSTTLYRAEIFSKWKEETKLEMCGWL